MSDQSQHGGLQPAFNQFITLMNKDEAKDLVRSINLFMKDFKHRSADAEADSRAVQAFLQQMETAMAKHPLFANSTPQEQDAATEALEKYLMTKLHDRIFRPTEDIERDGSLAVRCEALAFVTPQHLEIPPEVVDDLALSRAATELNKINHYKAPRDKLVCILNCCRMINSLLASRTKAEGIGADDFTPLLIYVVIRARTPHLASNLAYIERYRYHAKLSSETQYYYIQLCGAATFIEMINATSLKVDRDEFLAHMLAAGAMTDEQLASLQSSNSQDVATAAPAAAGSGAAAGTAAAAAHPASDSIAKSTQAAAAAMPVGIRPDPGLWQGNQYQQPQQQQAVPLQMQPLPPVGGGPAGSTWPAAADPGYDHMATATGWTSQQPYQQQQQQQQWPQPQQQPPPPPAPPALPSIAELEARGAVLLAGRDAGSAASQLVCRHPFCCSSLDSLSLGDVATLLAAYKELVLRYEALTAALEQHLAQQQQSQQQQRRQQQEVVGGWNQQPAYSNASSSQAPAAAAQAAAQAAVSSGGGGAAQATEPLSQLQPLSEPGAAAEPIPPGPAGTSPQQQQRQGDRESAAAPAEGQAASVAAVQEAASSVSGHAAAAAAPSKVTQVLPELGPHENNAAGSPTPQGITSSTSHDQAAADHPAPATGPEVYDSPPSSSVPAAAAYGSAEVPETASAAGRPAAIVQQHPSAPDGATAAAAGGATAAAGVAGGGPTDNEAADQPAEVDALLELLLEEEVDSKQQTQQQQVEAAAPAAGAPSNASVPHQQQQQEQQQQEQLQHQQQSPAAADDLDDDLFATFNQRSSGTGSASAGSTPHAASAAAPSLLD